MSLSLTGRGGTPKYLQEDINGVFLTESVLTYLGLVRILSLGAEGSQEVPNLNIWSLGLKQPVI